MKILVIGENIYNYLNSGIEINRITIDDEEIEYKEKDGWYYIERENVNEDYYDYYIKFAQKKEIEIILIHKGTEQDNYLKKIQNRVEKIGFNKSIEGFHNTDKDVVDALIKQDFNTINELIIKPKIYLPKLSDLKHEIISLLDPIRVDIYGLIEKKFNDEYWNKLFKNNKYPEDIQEIFKKVKNFAYDNNTGIKNIVTQANLSDCGFWEEIRKLLPEISSSDFTNDENLNDLLKALQDADKNKLKKIINLYGNIFENWYLKLVSAIENLMKSL